MADSGQSSNQPVERHLDWEGIFNARDLGGLPSTDGRLTRTGAVVRSDTLDGLTADGWAALRAHGIRTVVDLRNDDERTARGEPPGLTTVHVPLDDVADTEFWNRMRAEPLDGTPLYYRPFLERKPGRCAAAIEAIARAAPGGVLVHCGGGRDRAGLVALLVLALARVEPEDIATDYQLSNVRLPRFWAAHGMTDQRPDIGRVLANHGTTERGAILELLDWLDVETYLLDAGVSAADLGAVRARLLVG